MSRYTKHYEYSLSDLRSSFREGDLNELQTWRRRVFQSLTKLSVIQSYVEYWNAKESDPVPGAWLLKDVAAISHAIKEHVSGREDVERKCRNGLKQLKALDECVLSVDTYDELYKFYRTGCSSGVMGDKKALSKEAQKTNEDFNIKHREDWFKDVRAYEKEIDNDRAFGAWCEAMDRLRAQEVANDSTQVIVKRLDQDMKAVNTSLASKNLLLAETKAELEVEKAARDQMRKDFRAEKDQMRRDFQAEKDQMREDFQAEKDQMREDFRAEKDQLQEAHATENRALREECEKLRGECENFNGLLNDVGTAFAKHGEIVKTEPDNDA
ncbi:uncharacterized protein KY384_004044 [Bacidia gigantensis]|uniref:uncharacterized protein n=1 Tax=Bacidia gigantensis TaxID=2732470 RepID=UPI001D044E15|nr:uncharacterized protein KY384_004044 [Bacidia gigantensis]KAG8530689.1 hypothetical protein KY384_004044 [Bacidia gigantensis]